MAKSVLGVNLGNYSLKLVALSRSGPRLSVLGLYTAPTREAIVSGEVIQPDVVATEIRNLLSRARGIGRDSVLSIGGQSGVVVRVTELPSMPRKELLQAIPYEIDRQIPFQSGEAIKDFVLLKEPEEVPQGGQIPVLFAAARSDLVDAYLAAVRQAGLSPIAVEVEPLAAIRAYLAFKGFYSDGEVPSDQVAILVNIGHEGTEISFVEGTTLLLTRTVPVGGRHFTEDIRDYLGLTMEEAERVKIEQARAWFPEEAAPAGSSTMPTATQEPEGHLPAAPMEERPAPPLEFSFDFTIPGPEETGPAVPPAAPPTRPLEFVPSEEPSIPSYEAAAARSPERECYEAILSRLTELANEIHRSAEYLMSQRGSVNLEGVYLLGGGALLTDLDRFLEHQLGVPVTLLNPFLHMDTSAVEAQFGKEYIQKMAPVFAIGVGLSLWVL
ncbi:MAG: type IV pilus assembly protein PilM [Armatimonadetes bacterium]|nr:type IV pilus assembly protein PilM [Armatimonadota bacterium]MDW8122258.1 type IV pilus assembly protein PilM [Armatimonadota bacterium]